MYSAAEQSGWASDWLEVTEDLQRRVLTEAGVEVGCDLESRGLAWFETGPGF